MRHWIRSHSNTTCDCTAGPGNTITSWPAGYNVSGMAINPTTRRLYVSGTRSTMTENIVAVYNLNNLTLPTPTTPALVTTLNVSAQPGWSIQAPSMPSDITGDWTNTAGRAPRVFVFLRGTGGLISFADNGTTIGALSTVGLGSIPSSASDAVSTGPRLAYDPVSDVVWGDAREARVIFTVDPVTFEIVQKPTPTAVDGIWFLNTGSSFLLDRTNSRIYIGQ